MEGKHEIPKRAADQEETNDSQSNIKRHLKQNESPAKKQKTDKICPICDSKFKRKADCERHIKSVHEGVRPFQCSECNLSFPYSGNLSRHFRSIHEDEKKFKCDKCDYQSARLYQIKNHKKNIHD